MTTPYKKKLIEVALPLEDINREAAREKSIRHGHPSTLHLWWARRPLAACRAVLFASLVDDPSECVAELMADATKRKAAEKVLAAQRKAWESRKAVFDKAVTGGVPASSLSAAAQAGNPPPGLPAAPSSSAAQAGPEPKLEEILVETERERLFDIIRELVKWENSNDERVLNKARAEILRSTGGNLPAPRPDLFFVYAIQCDDGSHYIGQTDDLRRRWMEHVEGRGADWTKRHKPVRIAHWEEFSSREESVKRESDLKTGFGRKWLKELIASGRARQAGPPPVYDPFCGGGSIPLEAQRLGLEAHASDLNPVPVLINKALIEIPPKFAGKPPVNPESRKKLSASGSWKGAAGLAEDIRYYGQWMRDEAE
jgi:adenine-specific DNA methylase